MCGIFGPNGERVTGAFGMLSGPVVYEDEELGELSGFTLWNGRAGIAAGEGSSDQMSLLL